MNGFANRVPVIAAILLLSLMPIPAISSQETANRPVLEMGGVDPDYGTTDTLFTFFVTYSHPDGIEPDSVLLTIVNTSVVMTSKGKNYTDGVIYKTSLRVPEGDHDYYFTASSGGEVARFPEDGRRKVMVTRTVDPSLFESGVVPENGTTAEAFTFTTTYYDPLGREPDLMIVRINGVAYNMTPTGEDWKNGVEFQYTLSLDEGIHDYYFFTRTEEGSAHDPPGPGMMFRIRVALDIPFEIIDEGVVLSREGPDRFRLELKGNMTGDNEVKLILGERTFRMRRTSVAADGSEEFMHSMELNTGTHSFHYLVIWDEGRLRYPDGRNITVTKEPDILNDDPNIPPNAVILMDSRDMRVILDAGPSYDDDGQLVGYMWEVDGNPHLGARIELDLKDQGIHHGKLTVSDNDGATDTENIEIWAYDGSIDSAANPVVGHFKLDEELNVRRVAGTSQMEKSGDCSFRIAKGSMSPGLTVMEISKGVLSDWENSGMNIILNGSAMDRMDLGTVISTSGSTDMCALVENEGSYQLIIYTQGAGELDLSLCVSESAEKEDMSAMVVPSVITYSLASTMMFIILTIGVFLLFRTRSTYGPRSDPGDFAISTDGPRFRERQVEKRGKKIEWEAYLEE